MRIFLLVILLLAPLKAVAQELEILTVTRPPFSLVENGTDTGFSIDLWRALADEIGLEYKFKRLDSFSEMIQGIVDADADAAIANISITAARETQLDFSQPIFEAGLQIMIPANASTGSVWTAIMSRDLLLAVALAFALLFGGGMLMWHFERKHQPYFDLPPSEAMFPAFWWALNLVVNGGFEERQPRSPLGRLFGVFLVISSLFLVSLFVAKITAVLTVEAIQSNVQGLNDLYGKRIGTIEGSTSTDFLTRRDFRYAGYPDLNALIDAFEHDEIDAVVFDAPILAYYVNNGGGDHGRLIGNVFVPENYGIALPSSSDLAEPINQSLLKLRENGTYSTIYRKWFGNN